jgi:hypothetical protein
MAFQIVAPGRPYKADTGYNLLEVTQWRLYSITAAIAAVKLHEHQQHQQGQEKHPFSCDYCSKSTLLNPSQTRRRINQRKVPLNLFRQIVMGYDQ